MITKEVKLDRPQLLEESTGPISCTQAFEMLELLGYMEEEVLMGRQQKRCTVTEVKEWATKCEIMHMPASSLPRVWFCGGPPGSEDWYCGTLRTYVMDRVFTEEAFTKNYDLLRALRNQSKKVDHSVYGP